MKQDIGFLVRWVTLAIAGMALGVFVVAEVILLVLNNWFGVAGVPAELAVVVLLLVTGAAHGLAMGAAQSVLLKSRFGVARYAWVYASGAGAAIAWALGSIALFAGDEPWTAAQLAGILFAGGALLGSVVGLAQWTVLRRSFAHSVFWIPANGIAWVAASALAWAAMESLPPDPGSMQILGAAAAGTLAAGIAVGSITGLCLVVFAHRREDGPDALAPR